LATQVYTQSIVLRISVSITYYVLILESMSSSNTYVCVAHVISWSYF